MSNKERLANLIRGITEPVQPQEALTPVSIQGNNEQEEQQEQPQQPDIIDTVEDAALREALRKKRMDGRGRPRKDTNSHSVSDDYQRVCVIVNTEKMEKIREMSFRETLTIKEVVEAAFDLAISKYEKKHGEIKPNKAARCGDVSKLFD